MSKLTQDDIDKMSKRMSDAYGSVSVIDVSSEDKKETQPKIQLPSISSGLFGVAYTSPKPPELSQKPDAQAKDASEDPVSAEREDRLAEMRRKIDASVEIADSVGKAGQSVEQPIKSDFPTIDAAKQAVIGGIEKIGEAVSFEEKKPEASEFAQLLHTLSPDKITPEIRKRASEEMDPEVLEQFPEWLAKTDVQHRAIFDKRSEKTTIGDDAKAAWNLGVSMAKGFGEAVTRSVAGAGKAGAMFMEGPGAYGSFTDPEEWKRWGKNLGVLATVPGVTAFEASESVANTAMNALRNGLRPIDFLEEKAGLISRDEAFDRYLRRKRANEYYAKWKATDPNVFTRVIMQDPYAREVAERFLYSVTSVFSPSIEDRLARHNGDREAAMREKQLDDLRDSQQLLSSIRSDATKVVPDPDIVEAASNTKLGLDVFDIYGRTIGAGVQAARKAKRGLDTAGKSAAEISKMDADAAQKAFQKELDAAKKGAGKIEGALGSIADITEGAARRSTAFLEGIPDPVKGVVSGLGGGLVGASQDEENPLRGFVVGAGSGLGSYAGLSKAGAIADVAVKTPRVAEAFVRGRRASAGIEPNAAGLASAIEKAADVGMNPKVAKFMADKGLPAAKAIDWAATNALEMARGGVHGAALAAAVGVLENKDPKEIAQMMGEGMFWHVSGHVLNNLTGVSADRYEADLQRKRVAAAKFVTSLDPETQAAVNKLTDWNGYVAQARNLTDAAQKAYDEAQAEYSNEGYSGKTPEQLEKFKNKAEEAREVLKIRKAQEKNAEAAGPETARMYGDQVRIGMADLMNSINGRMTPGKNVDLRIVASDQLVKEALANNESKLLNPLEQAELANIVKNQSEQRAFWSRNGGQIQLSTGKVVSISDPNKGRITVNMDKVARRVNAGEAALSAVAHEAGHALWESKEFREQNADVINALFGTQKFDDRGNLVAGEPGMFSTESLIEKFKNQYAKGVEGGWEGIAKNAGLYDYSTNDVDPQRTADYMRAEVMAELVRGASQGGISLGESPKPWLAPLVDWLTVKNKNSTVNKAVREFVGLTGEKPWASEIVGVPFSADMIEKTRKALRGVAELNGDISAAESIPHKPITETQIRSDEAVANQFKDGIFATEKVATVADRFGEPVVDSKTGQPVHAIPIFDPNAFDGVWEHQEGETGQPTLIKTSGYGDLPAEVADKLGDVHVPVGGRIVVTTRVKRDSSGALQMLTPQEARALNRARGDILRRAMEDAPDKDYPGRLSPQSADRLSFGGVLSPGQIENLKRLPESILPYAMKKRILDYNQLLLNDRGESMIGLYAQAMNARGQYQSFAPKIVDFVPLGLKMSKDGNFLFTLFTKSGMREKLRRWAKDAPDRLSLWEGNKDAFMEDVNKLLKNWTPTKENPRGLPGETGLDADPAVALAKKNRINDFFNIYRKTEEASLLANPNRTVIKKPARRLSKAEKADENESDPNTLVRSYRVDRFHDLAVTGDDPMRINYGKALYNLMPEKETAEPEEVRSQLSPLIERGLRGVRGGIQFMPEGEEDPTMVAPGFYSKAGRVLLEKMPNRASVEQIKGILDPQKGSGVKPDELKWSGLIPHIQAIQAEKGSVSKQDIVDFLKNNYSARFEEVEYADRKYWEVTYSNGDHQIFYNKEEAENKRQNEVYDFIEWIKANNWYSVVKDGTDEQDSGRKNQGWIIINKDDGDNQFAGPQYNSRNKKIFDIAKSYESKKEAQSELNNFFKKWAESETEIEEGFSEGSRYSRYKLWGGKNYREVILKMPDDVVSRKRYSTELIETSDGVGEYQVLLDGKPFGRPVMAKTKEDAIEKAINRRSEKAYTSSHFPSVQNYIAHARLAEHGNGLLIEELQSDLHQEARNKGYSELSDDGFGEGVPDAPFRKDWPLQLFKSSLKDAVDSGKKWIGWTGGEAQANRYQLSKQISSIDLINDGEGKYHVTAYDKADSNNFYRQVFERSGVSANELPELIGKELSKNLIEDLNSQPNQKTAYARATGLQLNVGGEGMKGFYDNILPKEIGKYVKQWGVVPYEYELDAGGPHKIWRIDIPESMRKSVFEGQPQFMPEKLDSEYIEAHKSKDEESARKLVENAARQAGYSTRVFYHGTPTGGFNEFDPELKGTAGGRARGGFSFTTDKRAAESYSQGFSDDKVALNKAVSIINKAFRKHDNNENALKIIGEKEYSDPSIDVAPEYDSQFFDEGMPEVYNWFLDKAKKYKNQLPDISNAFTDAAKALKSDAATPEVKSVYLKIPEGTKEIDSTKESLAEDIWGLDVRKEPNKAFVVNLEDGNSIAYIGDPSAIKSADTFTYDDQGNLIPLSQRFGVTADVRFMPEKDVDKLKESEKISNYEQVLNSRQSREREVGAGGRSGDEQGAGILGGGLEEVFERAARREDSQPEQVRGRTENRRASEAAKRAQDARLVETARRHGAILDHQDFLERWQASGSKMGAEHQVILGSENGKVEKRTNIPIFEESWGDYFDRIRLHNILFPETKITVKGVHDQTVRSESNVPADFSGLIARGMFASIVPDPGAYVVTEQPYVKILQPLSLKEIDSFLNEKNFFSISRGNNFEFYNPKAKVFLRDAHEGNVVSGLNSKGEKTNFVIDVPMRYATPEDADDIKTFNRKIFAKLINGTISEEKFDEIRPFLTDPTVFGSLESPLRRSQIQFMPEKQHEEWIRLIETAKEAADEELNRLRQKRLDISESRFEHHISEEDFGDSWSFVPPKDKYFKNPSMYDIYESGGKYYIGEDYGGGFKTLQDAKEESMQRAMSESWATSQSTFGSDLDSQNAVSTIFDSFPKQIGDITNNGWFTTKWGSWYLEGRIPTVHKDDYETFKLSIRDHDSGTRFQKPDKSFFVSKEWKPDEVAAALKKALNWIINESKFNTIETEPSVAQPVPQSDQVASTSKILSDVKFMPEKSLVSEEEMRKLDALADKKAKQVDADTLPYPVNPNPDSVTLPPRYGLVNANIVGMPRSFNDVQKLLGGLVTRLTNVANRDPKFALEAASFYSDMADSALKLADAVQPDVSGMQKWLSAELNMRFLALGSPKSAVAANATKSGSSVAGTASDFAAGFKIGMGEQAIGAATTQKAWKRGEHFDLSLPGVQDKVRSFYLNGLAELIELAQKEGDAAAVKELMLRAGKSMRVFDPAEKELDPAGIKEVQRLLDGKATVDMWDMAAKGEAWPGYLMTIKERNKKTEPFQWSQDKFEKKSDLSTPQWQKVLSELKISGPEDLRYQQARALKIDGNAAWDEASWEARKQQPFPETTKFSYYTKATEAGLSPGGGGPLYDAQQAIDGMLADRINELGLAPMFGKEKLKARNAQEILWALEKLDNPIKRNNDLSLFKASFDPFMDEILALRGVPAAARSHLGRNVLGAMDRTYAEMARQVMPLEVVSGGTSVEAKRIQQKIADLEAAGDTNAAKTLTDWVADGLHDVINTFAAKHGLKVTADRVAVGEGAYTEATQLNVSPNMRIVLRGDPAHTYQVLEALSRALDQDGGNIIRKPSVRELNDVNIVKNKILTFDTNHLSQADRNRFFLEASKLVDADGNPFLTGFTETEDGLAVGNQFYSGDFEAAINQNMQQIQALITKYNIPDMSLEKAIIDTFYRGQEPSKTTTSPFAKAIYGHIANKLSSTPQAASFPQAVDFETLWRSRADSLKAAIEQYPIRTKPQIKKAKANAPEIASATKQTQAHTELKSQLLAAVLRDEISKKRYKELMAEYGYAKEDENESDE